MIFKCTIPGRPYVKKNQQRMFGSGRNKRVVYTPQYVAWEKIACLAVNQAFSKMKSDKVPLFSTPVNLSAKFFFKDRQGEADLSALLEGSQDVLEFCRILANDKLIISLNGSGKFFGEREPRTEIEVEAV